MKRFKKAKDIKVGIIGYGGAFNMGKFHFQEIANAGMTPVAVAETDHSRLKAAEADFPGIETYSSGTAMLRKSQVDLVTIITPHNTHAKLAMSCLRARTSVVCEKPLAITTAECDAMIAAAKKNGVLLSAYHNRHWDGCILQALKKIRAGVIGDIVRIEAHMGQWANPSNWWRASKSISGGVMYDWGVHLLEYGLQLIDGDITEVSGFARHGFWAPKTNWKGDTNEDEGFGIVRFKNGIWLSLCITNIDSNPKLSMLEITGTTGSYLMDLDTWQLIKRGANGRIVATKESNPPSEGWRFYKNIADHLTKGANLVITPQWARRPIHVLDLMGKSARKGVSLKPKYK